MANAYVVIADWDWEGQDPVEVFSSKSKADYAAMRANDYLDTKRGYKDVGPVDIKVWEAGHPYPDSARCEKFFVKEVPLDADQTA